MSTSPFLPPDVRESDLDPVACSRCAELEGLLEETLGYLEDYEGDSFDSMEVGEPSKQWRQKLLDLIDRIRGEI